MHQYMIYPPLWSNLCDHGLFRMPPSAISCDLDWKVKVRPPCFERWKAIGCLLRVWR